MRSQKAKLTHMSNFAFSTHGIEYSMHADSLVCIFTEFLAKSKNIYTVFVSLFQIGEPRFHEFILICSSMRLKTIFAVLLLLGTVWTQDEDDAADTEGGEDKEECEEAWEYLEFLKTNVK